MKSNSFAQLLLLGALWGAAFMFMRVAVPEFGALSMAAARVAIALGIMLVIVAALRLPLDFRARWKTYLAVGAVNTTIPFIAYSFAAQHIPAGYSAIANSTTPVWGALIAWLWFKERLGPAKWVGIVCAFAGVLVLVGLQPVRLTPMVLAGIAAAVAAAGVYAAASFLIKRYFTGNSGFAGATGMVWGAMMWLLLPGVFFAPDVMPSAKAWGAIFALSVFCTVAGYALFFHLIKTIGPQRASSVAFLFPAFAAFWGWLVLSEPITANMVAGMAFVLLGTALVSRASATEGPTTFWERLRDQIMAPIAFACVPALLRRALAQHVSNADRYYANKSASVRRMMPTFLPEASVDVACAEMRFTDLCDHADLWVSTLKGDAWMRKNLRLIGVQTPPPRPALFITFHYGGGWWMTRWLRAAAHPVSIVMRRGRPAGGWWERAFYSAGAFRMRQVEQVCRSPLIATDDGNTARAVLRTWKRGSSVIGLVDLPPSLVDRTQAVSFMGRTAHFPPTLFELAHHANVPIFVYFGYWEHRPLRPVLEVYEVTGQTPAESMQKAITQFEVVLSAVPGRWHQWGDIDLYFQDLARSTKNA